MRDAAHVVTGIFTRTIQESACIRERWTGWLQKAATILLSAVREIFDETAYERFLRRMQMPSSPESYAAFRAEQGARKARCPRCC